MIRIIVITLLFFCISCSGNSDKIAPKKGNQTTEYKDLKIVQGRTYSEVQIFDRTSTLKPEKRIVKLDRPTRDPVSSAMYELTKSGLKFNGKNIRVQKIERDGSQWEIYFTSNKNPPKNLGADGNYMVKKTLDYYIDNYDVYLDGEKLFDSKRKKATQSEIDEVLRKESEQIEKELNSESHKH